MEKSDCACKLCPKHENAISLPGPLPNMPSNPYVILENLVDSTSSETKRLAGTTPGSLFDTLATGLKSVGVTEGFTGSMTGRFMIILDNEIRRADTGTKAKKLTKSLKHIAKLATSLSDMLEDDVDQYEDFMMPTTNDPNDAEHPPSPNTTEPDSDSNADEDLLNDLADHVANTRAQAHEIGGIEGVILNIVADCEEHIGVTDGYAWAGHVTTHIMDEIVEGDLDEVPLMELFKYTSALTGMLYARIGKWMVEDKLGKLFGRVETVENVPDDKSASEGDNVVGDLRTCDDESGREAEKLAFGLGVTSLEDVLQKENTFEGDKISGGGKQGVEEVAAENIQAEKGTSEGGDVAGDDAIFEEENTLEVQLAEGLGAMSLEEKVIAAIQKVFKDHSASDGDRIPIQEGY